VDNLFKLGDFTLGDHTKKHLRFAAGIQTAAG